MNAFVLVSIVIFSFCVLVLLCVCICKKRWYCKQLKSPNLSYDGVTLDTNEKMLKIAIVSFDDRIGKDTTNVYARIKSNHHQYATKHNYDHYWGSEVYVPEGWHHCWAKIYYLKSIVSQLQQDEIQYVMWIDSDAYVNWSDLDMRKIIKLHNFPDIIVSKDPPTWFQLQACAGIMIISIKELENLINDMFGYANKFGGWFKKHSSYDQACLNGVLNQYNAVTLPYHVLNYTCYDEDIAYRQKNPEFQPFIVHCMGKTQKKHLEFF